MERREEKNTRQMVKRELEKKSKGNLRGNLFYSGRRASEGGMWNPISQRDWEAGHGNQRGEL